MKRLFLAPAVAVALFLASCSGGNGSNDQSAAPAATSDTTANAAPSASASTPGSDIPGIADLPVSTELDLTGDDQMKFNTTLFKVKAGTPVKVVMKNIGKLPAAAMSHNVVILLPGTDVQAFGEAAVAAAKTEHIPQNMINDVLGHTKMLGPGESDTITVTFPKAGVYDFICTFPGHFASMHGKIVAE